MLAKEPVGHFGIDQHDKIKRGVGQAKMASGSKEKLIYNCKGVSHLKRNLQPLVNGFRARISSRKRFRSLLFA